MGKRVEGKAAIVVGGGQTPGQTVGNGRATAIVLGREFAVTVLRSLARIGTQSARQALELVAARHPDPTLRQRAETEAIILARRHGTTLAPG